MGAMAICRFHRCGLQSWLDGTKLQEEFTRDPDRELGRACSSPDFSPRGKLRLKISMVNIRKATPQINRFGTDAERGQLSEWEAVVVEKLRVLWSKV
jgi:hypothetical protein